MCQASKGSGTARGSPAKCTGLAPAVFSISMAELGWSCLVSHRDGQCGHGYPSQTRREEEEDAAMELAEEWQQVGERQECFLGVLLCMGCVLWGCLWGVGGGTCSVGAACSVLGLVLDMFKIERAMLALQHRHCQTPEVSLPCHVWGCLGILQLLLCTGASASQVPASWVLTLLPRLSVHSPASKSKPFAVLMIGLSSPNPYQNYFERFGGIWG